MLKAAWQVLKEVPFAVVSTLLTVLVVLGP